MDGKGQISTVTSNAQQNLQTPVQTVFGTVTMVTGFLAESLALVNKCGSISASSHEINSHATCEKFVTAKISRSMVIDFWQLTLTWTVFLNFCETFHDVRKVLMGSNSVQSGEPSSKCMISTAVKLSRRRFDGGREKRGGRVDISSCHLGVLSLQMKN